MKKLKKKDNAIRIDFKKKELKLRILKNLQKNNLLRRQINWKSFDLLKSYGNDKPFTAINNRCVATVSKKSVNKNFRFSRLELLRHIREGRVNGLKKAVW